LPAACSCAMRTTMHCDAVMLASILARRSTRAVAQPSSSPCSSIWLCERISSVLCPGVPPQSL
jgi:hypothetical protein